MILEMNVLMEDEPPGDQGEIAKLVELVHVAVSRVSDGPEPGRLAVLDDPADEGRRYLDEGLCVRGPGELGVDAQLIPDEQDRQGQGDAGGDRREFGQQGYHEPASSVAMTVPARPGLASWAPSGPIR